MLTKITGTVECFITAAGGSFVEVKSSTSSMRESFVLFFASHGGASLVSAMWSSTLSAARASGKPVTIQHDEGSSQIVSVTIGDNPLI